MSAEINKQIELEIAHVLFIDIVGYSKLSINEQRAAVDELNDVVRASGQFQKAEAADRLIKIPTGDGMALVFYTSPEAPAQCAVEISGALKEHPRLQLRMGVHSGPVSGVIDVNGHANLAGAGLNMAQRVMDCGDAGHILVSKRVAEDLGEYEHWRPLLHDLGECEVKHRTRVSIVNLYADEVGNPQIPKKFQALKKHRARMRWAAMTAALLALAAIVAGIAMFSRNRVRPTLAAPDKSIAVLPFENRSRDPDNAYFADGIQDEILTRLSKIADLKVISRTSTQHYKSAPENLPEIARQLGVAHILEGSVQKSGEAVRVNVQLIKAANDSHLWADSFDRKLTDIFSVESEVAKAIADQLRAKLTGQEEQVIAAKPTDNPEAYDAYLRGLAYSLRPGFSPADGLNALRYFEEAVKLDSKFALAWAWLAYERALCYWVRIGDNLPALREAAKRAAEKAIELQPDMSEAYLAQGYSRYYGDRDYDGAIISFEKARQLSPNNSQVLRALALICRRRGEWQCSLDYFRQAIQFDPRNASLLADLGEMYDLLGQFPAALKAYDQVLDIIPDNADALASKAGIYQAQGKLEAAGALLGPLHPPASSVLFSAQIEQWIYQRRYADAINALTTVASTPDPSLTEWDKIHHEASLAWLQQLSGEVAAARITWQHVRVELEASRPNRGEDSGVWELASANVALGDKAKAFAIIERAAAIFAVSKDVLMAGDYRDMMARIAVRAGEKDLALKQLAVCAQNYPSGRMSYGDLKLNPEWDSLRGDPRFEKIVASLAPKQ
jgi:TolB-like protein/class 3 adenylate cyclase